MLSGRNYPDEIALLLLIRLLSTAPAPAHSTGHLSSIITGIPRSSIEFSRQLDMRLVKRRASASPKDLFKSALVFWLWMAWRTSLLQWRKERTASLSLVGGRSREGIPPLLQLLHFRNREIEISTGIARRRLLFFFCLVVDKHFGK